MGDSESSWSSTVINEQLRKRLESHKSAKVTKLFPVEPLNAFALEA